MPISAAQILVIGKIIAVVDNDRSGISCMSYKLNTAPVKKAR